MRLFRAAIQMAFLSMLFTPGLRAQEKFVANYDEAKVPSYMLEDPLEGVTDATAWKIKRAEILALFEKEMFGRAPKFDGGKIAVGEALPAFEILGGKAMVSQPVIKVAGQDVRLLVILPAKANKPVPAFMGYSFGGNHTVFKDERIALAQSWMKDGKAQEAKEADRGKSASRWGIERIINAGYGLITLYYADVDPDFHDGFKNGIFAKHGVPKADEWASIAGWSWALSRVLDFVEQTPIGVDATKVAVMGHSRLGKTSLWAGATDERFAMIISNNSGCGGAALSKRAFGETVGRITKAFPHWFSGNYNKYANNESALTFDQHMLLALMAPRPLYVASAEDDQWADPHGEFLSCVAADPVYRLLGTDGLPAKAMPKVNQPMQGQIAYHIRNGKHDVTDFDWEQYIKFAKKHL
ncbi:MAG: hypothetical protein ACI8T1_000518 [Verrucomicrobiales bacterium]|jgi:hypothetical protein